VSKRQNRSRFSYIVLVLLAAITVVLAAILIHIYPEYRDLKKRDRDMVKDERPAVEPESATTLRRPVVAKLYFARIVEGKQRMVAINRELPPGLGVAQSALEELIRGEVPRGCDRPLPPGTTVLSIRVENGVATVDFSQQLRAGFRGGSDNEQLTIYSVVNTLASLPTIDQVQILIGGEAVNTLGGHHDISGPLSFDPELVVPHT